MTATPREGSRMRLLLVDDHTVLREGLKALFASQPDLEVVGEAAETGAGLRMAEKLRPDLVILDLSLPGGGGLQLIPRLRESLPETRILVLTMHEDVALLRSAVAAGAGGYLLKSSPANLLLAAIRKVAAGGRLISPELEEELVPPPLADSRTREPLSPREKEVLALLALGRSRKEIAELLDLSIKTVETYRTRLTVKLGLRTRADIVRFALEAGILSAGSVSPSD